jgi:maltose/moltooligosaccharide transporter
MLIDMIPPERNGVYMGIFNMFIVIPMIIESLTVPLFYHSLLNGEPRNILYLAGALMVLGAIATARVTLPPRRAVG